jgi:hypothetical protein
MTYQQNLWKIVEPVKLTTIHRRNKAKSWKYGYDKETDIIVISKTGQIGEIYEIQNLQIALPPVENVKDTDDRWKAYDYPNDLKNVKTIFDWRTYPREFQEKWEDYINEEFDRRENGYWFKNNGEDTYITGTH